MSAKLSNKIEDQEANLKVVVKIARRIFPSKVLADLTIVQAILESRIGRLGIKISDLAYYHNNLFGVTGLGDKGYAMIKTKEYSKGKGWYQDTREFASYSSLEECFKARIRLLENGIKSNPTIYHKVLQAKTFEEAAKEIAKAGYATDPNYANLLIDVYNKRVKNLETN
jgi:flagellum-specific peptidoglycan hydrolase FlgJ